MALKILSLIGREQEKRVVNLFEQHSNITLEMSKLLERAATEVIDYKHDAVEKSTKAIRDMENEADNIRRKIEVQLYEGAFLPETRRQLYMIARWMDEVANAMQDASEAFLLMKKTKLPKDFIMLFKAMIKHTANAVAALHEEMYIVIENKIGLRSAVAKVSNSEHSVDIIKAQLMGFLFLKAKLKPLDVMILRKVVDEVDRISDVAEDCSDFLALLRIMKQA